MLVFFAIHVAHWHWPYRIEGALDELPLLGVALGAGAAAALLLARVVPLFRSLGAASSGAAVALFAFLAVQGADLFAAERNWRYAPAWCDFAVEFPRRAGIVTGEALNDARMPSAVERALFTDIGRATSYSAECLDLGRAIEGAERTRLLDMAEARLKAAAARLRAKVERVSRDGDSAVVLSGLSDEGRNANNVVLLRRTEGRAVLGRSSLMVVWTWSVLREGEALPPSIARFHGSIVRDRKTRRRPAGRRQAAVRLRKSAQASRGGVVGIGAGNGRLISRETRVLRRQGADHAMAGRAAQ